MRTRNEPETEERRIERQERDARRRAELASTEAKELDAAVKRSIKLHGA